MFQITMTLGNAILIDEYEKIKSSKSYWTNWAFAGLGSRGLGAQKDQYY